MDPALEELLEEGAPDDEVSVILRLRDPGRAPDGIRIVSRFGPIVTCRVARAAIPAIRSDPATVSLKAPMRYSPDVETEVIGGGVDAETSIDSALDERWAPEFGATGSKVVLATVDWGLDVAHPDFRHPDGSTRVLALWDQRPTGGASGASAYGYGRVLGPAEINRALDQEDPYAALGYNPADFDAGFGAHGTHTTSIAAGNGLGGGPRGVAPEADLVFVNLGKQGQATTPLGDSVELLEALHFIVDTAGDRPCVINMSLGRHAGEHTGHSLVEMAMDHLVSETPGRAIVQSCGNYFQRRTHSAWLLRPGDSKRLRLQIDPSDRTTNEVDIWYSGRDRLWIELASADGRVRQGVALGDRARLAVDGTELARMYHRRCDPNNGDHECRIFLEPSRLVADWEVTVVAEDVVDGRVHAWIERDSGCRTCQSFFAPGDAVPYGSTGSISNGYLTVAVGAYDPRDPARPPGRFSSSGPTRDGRQKPDLCAPGVATLGARSTPREESPGARYIRMSGTSMAAPHVAGTVALLFDAADRKLSIQETRAMLLAGCERPASDDLRRLGSGYLRPAEALTLLRGALMHIPTENDTEAEAVAAENIFDDTSADADPDAPALDVESEAETAYGEGREPWGAAESDGENEEFMERDCGTSEVAEALLLEALERLDRLNESVPATSPVWHREVLKLCGVPVGSGGAGGVAEVFDTYAHQAAATDPQWPAVAGYFDPIGQPSRPMTGGVRTGDVVIRRARGSPYSTVSLVARPGLASLEGLGASTDEGPSPTGYYATVQGAVPSASPSPGVQVLDGSGLVPPATLVLRPRVWQSFGDAVPGPCADVEVRVEDRPRVLIRGSVHPAVRNAQRKLNLFHAHRLGAGLPGLQEAPLVDDCIFGKHTAAAVRSFQEVVFPGLPKEHDGKIGPKTWAQLDAVATGPGAAALVSVDHVILTDDGFSGPLTWDKVVGVDSTTINVEVAASGLPVTAMPAHVVVEVGSRPPNRASGSGTLSPVAAWEVPFVGPDAARPDRALYRLRKPMTVAPFLDVERKRKEVATVVRVGGTSDAVFRHALGWAPRGVAVQPAIVGGSSGSEATETPDARTLLRAGGVEVLEVRFSPLPNWRAASGASRLVQSPADVIYYTGHGLGSSGQLAIDTLSKPCRRNSGGDFRPFLGASDLRATWRSPMDLDVLILAGCSVLNIDVDARPPTGPGLAWADLLTTRGGPLSALLGYRASAPCDNPNGEVIAEEMGKCLASGSCDFARRWLEINGKHNADNAVAIDARGYWRINSLFLGRFEIQGPVALP